MAGPALLSLRQCRKSLKASLWGCYWVPEAWFQNNPSLIDQEAALGLHASFSGEIFCIAHQCQWHATLSHVNFLLYRVHMQTAFPIVLCSPTLYSHTLEFMITKQMKLSSELLGL